MLLKLGDRVKNEANNGQLAKRNRLFLLRINAEYLEAREGRKHATNLKTR